MNEKMEKMPVSTTEKLTNFYKAAPAHLTFFAGSPYMLTYAIGKSLVHVTPFADSRNSRTRMALAGVSFCSIFTVLPVLPIGTALTLGLAVTGGVIAALSTPIAYPIAMIKDQRDSNHVTSKRIP